jgi:hypothetical protein
MVEMAADRLGGVCHLCCLASLADPLGPNVVRRHYAYEANCHCRQPMLRKGKIKKDKRTRPMWFAGEPQDAKTPEARRLGSDIAVISSLAYGRLNMFPFAEMMANNSVLRDATNPFACEALGLSRAMNGYIDDARVCFMKGLGFARESQPEDTETEERIKRQLVWLSEHASTINELYERRDAELFD